MSFWKCFVLALKSITTSKMRAFLTMLGIIIGVAAVIILVSLMNGLTSQVTGVFEDMGANTINITIRDRGNTYNQVDPEDMQEFVEKNNDVISDFSPTVTTMATLKNGSNTIDTQATGVSETYSSIKALKIEQGSFIRYIDVKKSLKVCVVGTYIQNEFFEGESALGKEIKLNGYNYTIIGVLEETDDSSSASTDNVVYIPYTNALKLNRNMTVSSYVLVNSDEDRLDFAMDKIRTFLNKKVGDSDYYSIMSMRQVLDNFNTVTDSMQSILVFIASISLLVGGIGIMNIMLVSVTERTREIGIRKSLGAKQRDIMLQFVIEAGTVSSVGGIIGIIVGSLIAILAGKIIDLEVMPSVGAVGLAFGVSVGIGLLFGYLPAKNAAKLNPIDALRHE